MKNSIYLVLLLLFMFSCKEPEARKPIEHSVSNFYKEVMAQNKKLNKLENEKIKQIIAKDTVLNFQSSSNGLWYAYVKKDTIKGITPKTGDIVTLSYDIATLFNQPIYEEKKVTYKVDKQDFFPGLEEGLKIMKEGEKAVFIVPSYTAYGVTGDGNRIKINQPIKSTVKLIQIKKDNEKN